MSETTSAVKASDEQFDDSESYLIPLLITLAKHKKLIVFLPLAAAIVAAVVSMVLPSIYKAGTKLLPPQQAQSSAAGLLSQLGGAAGIAGGIAGIKNPNDLYVGMLRSRSVADKLIEQFDLVKVYDTESQEKARKVLAEQTVISAGKDGLITIEVEDKDKKLVAPLANGYVAALLKLTTTLAVTEASQRRVFFERQLEDAKNKLAAAEMKLRGGLDSHGVISVDSDSRAIVETVGRLRAQVSAKEIQLGSMQAFVTQNNREYRRVGEELSSLRAELSKLENGRPPTVRQPAPDGNKHVGLDNIKILRDVKYYQMLYELLAKQYQVARLDEAKDNSMIQVLDTAIEPELKFKPRRAVIVLIATALAFLLACCIAVVIEAKARMLQIPEYALQWSQLMGYLRFKRPLNK